MTTSRGIYIFIVVAISFIIKGLVGFGDPLIFNPLLSVRMDNKHISPGMLPVSILLNAFIVYKSRDSIHPRRLLPICFWVVLGIVPGTLLLKYSSSWTLKVALGVLIILLGLEMLTRKDEATARPNAVFMAVMSFSSGVTAALFGINLLFLVYLERTTTDRDEFRGSVCLVFLVESVFRLISYLANGIITPFSLQISTISVPAALLGTWLGMQIDKKIDDSLIKKLIVYVFIIGGISTVIRALLLHA
ncbi:MAG: sulfite exporter TauE/SafE family protein [Mogibacterium sp.]|nr:sulfite exporter TauE/SafE family protein [Mogibacterium sp.]